jgi:DNA-binding NarL/FixJ family response regulator
MAAKMSAKRTRILIADSHLRIRPALRAAIALQSGWTICAEATSALETLAKTIQFTPDVVLLDTGLPDFDAIEFTRELRRVAPASKVLVLSVFESAELARDFREAGAHGYLVKSDIGLALADAVSVVLDGRTFFKDRMHLVVGGSLDDRRFAAPRSVLTGREREVLARLADGQSNKEVAAALDISIKTVETHRARIMSKLEVHSIGGLVRYAIRNRLMDA